MTLLKRRNVLHVVVFEESHAIVWQRVLSSTEMPSSHSLQRGELLPWPFLFSEAGGLHPHDGPSTNRWQWLARSTWRHVFPHGHGGSLHARIRPLASMQTCLLACVAELFLLSVFQA